MNPINENKFETPEKGVMPKSHRRHHKRHKHQIKVNIFDKNSGKIIKDTVQGRNHDSYRHNHRHHRRHKSTNNSHKISENHHTFNLAGKLSSKRKMSFSLFLLFVIYSIRAHVYHSKRSREGVSCIRARH